MRRSKFIRNERIKLLLEHGISARQIAAEVMVSERTVYLHKRKWLEGLAEDGAAAVAELDGLLAEAPCMICGQDAAGGIYCQRCQHADFETIRELAERQR